MPCRPINNIRTTGCRTCKEKHTRCDKAQPACSQCASRSLQCPGYSPPPFRWVVAATSRKKKIPKGTSSTQKGLKKSRMHPASLPITSPHGVQPHVPSCRSILAPGPASRRQEASPPPVRRSSKNSEINLSNLSEFPSGSSLNSQDGDHISLPSPGRVPVVLEETFRHQYYINHYFEQVAPIMTILEADGNPFGEVLRDSLPAGSALFHTICGIGAIHLVHSSDVNGARDSAFRYKTAAYRSLRRTVAESSLGNDLFLTVLLLATTEVR